MLVYVYIDVWLCYCSILLDLKLEFFRLYFFPSQLLKVQSFSNIFTMKRILVESQRFFLRNVFIDLFSFILNTTKNLFLKLYFYSGNMIEVESVPILLRPTYTEEKTPFIFHINRLTT